MIYRTFIMAGRIMTLVVSENENEVSVITGRRATQAEIDTEEYKAQYIPRETFVCQRNTTES
jgi:hypothetical protein